ncbi:MAG TPA: Ig-like domain-containing protein, partial [Candidatus Saccharimonadales bacterium]|nr:Ig-like domain-containing protein [Candidatus Saccharimonadales bacterium]
TGVSRASAPVRYIYTTTKPRITILAPLHGATIATPTVSIEGRVPAGASVVVRNLTNTTGSAVSADSHGSFSVLITLDRGTNALVVSVTDRAGNVTGTSLSIVRAKTTHP